MCKSLLNIFEYIEYISSKLCLYVAPFPRYSALKNDVTLILGRGRSRSLKMAQFDRSCTTFYWSAIVSIAVCCTILKLFDVE